jgi:hypothetical protein
MWEPRRLTNLWMVILLAGISLRPNISGTAVLFFSSLCFQGSYASIKKIWLQEPTYLAVIYASSCRRYRRGLSSSIFTSSAACFMFDLDDYDGSRHSHIFIRSTWVGGRVPNVLGQHAGILFLLRVRENRCSVLDHSIPFACSNTGIVGSNPTEGMDVCLRLFCVCM